MIGKIFHSIANRAASLFMKLLFGYSSRIYLVGSEHVNRAGGFLLASNHISHFDPLIISSLLRRKIDWMAMAELTSSRLDGRLIMHASTSTADANELRGT